MKVYYDIKDFKRLDNAVATTGTFDGVHKGHQKILARLKELSNVKRKETVVITYWPHPRKVLSEGAVSPKVLYTLQERIELLREFYIDHLLVLQFTKEFSGISSEDYIRNILVEKIGVGTLVIGYDHRFGKNREGSFDYLLANAVGYGFEVEEIPREDIDSIAVSSSNIRKALAEGDVESANRYLGTAFHIIGKVVRGNQNGRKIGYPTANIAIAEEDKIIPRDGVYAVKVKVGDEVLQGMLNIGFRPTVDGNSRTIEVHIFNFDKDIYGQEIEVSFIRYLRQEQKFSGIEALKEQLNRDKEEALRIF